MGMTEMWRRTRQFAKHLPRKRRRELMRGTGSPMTVQEARLVVDYVEAVHDRAYMWMTLLAAVVGAGVATLAAAAVMDGSAPAGAGIGAVLGVSLAVVVLRRRVEPMGDRARQRLDDPGTEPGA